MNTWIFLMLINTCFIVTTAADNEFQSLIFALAQSLNSHNSNNDADKNEVQYMHQTRDLKNDSDESRENIRKPGITFQPLILVLINRLQHLTTRKSAPRSSEEQTTFEDSKDKWSALSLPFRLVQAYGMKTVSNYVPDFVLLKKYKAFYDQLSPTSTPTDMLDNAKKVKQLYDKAKKLRASSKGKKTEEVIEAEEKAKLGEEFLEATEGSSTSAIGGLSYYYVPSYATFEKYYPYAKHAIKIATFFVPGLGQYKQLMLGLEVMRIAWKVSDMYRRGESWFDIMESFGREIIASLGKRDEVDTIMSSSTQTAFIDVSFMETTTFSKIVQEMDYPPLSEKEEKIVREDITSAIDTYLEDINEDNRQQLIEIFEMTVKFIALHAIIPALE